MHIIMSLISLFNSFRRNIRRAGYIKDQNGIIRRYNIEYEKWQNHIAKCHQFIIVQLINYNGGKVAVLGSGWLLDVPMEELIDTFNQIDLIDINHPKQIMRKYENESAVNFIVKDLTNGLIEKANETTSISDFIEFMDHCEPILFKEKYDLVISINILNQLDIILCDFIKQKFKVKNEILLKIRSKVQQNHMDMIKNYKSCLISDSVEQQIYNNEIVANKSLIFCDLTNKTEDESWIWKFDTQKSYNPKFNTSFIVKAYNF